jgi:hypothetical protein
MTGAHRRPALRPAVLMARAMVPLVLLALTAVGIYLAIAHPAAAQYLVIGLQCVAWILVSGNFTWSLLRRPPRSLAQRVRLSRSLLIPAGATILLVSVLGQQHGWLHGGTESALTWTACAFSVAVPVWLVGERRLMAVLAARGAAGSGSRTAGPGPG